MGFRERMVAWKELLTTPLTNQLLHGDGWFPSDRTAAYVVLGLVGVMSGGLHFVAERPSWLLAMLGCGYLGILGLMYRFVRRSTPSIQLCDGKVAVELGLVRYRVQEALADCAVIHWSPTVRVRWPMLVLPDGMTLKLGSRQRDRLLAAGVPLAVKSADYDRNAMKDPRTDWSLFGRTVTVRVVRQIPLYPESEFDVAQPRSASAWWPGFNSVWVGILAGFCGELLGHAWFSAWVRSPFWAGLLSTAHWLSKPVGGLLVVVLLSWLRIVLPSSWFGLVLSGCLVAMVFATCLGIAASNLETSFGRYALWHAGPARPR